MSPLQICDAAITVNAAMELGLTRITEVYHVVHESLWLNNAIAELDKDAEILWRVVRVGPEHVVLARRTHYIHSVPAFEADDGWDRFKVAATTT